MKMLKRDRNICDIILFSSLGSFILLLILNYVTDISPIKGNWLLLYALCVLVTSIWITCVVIQYLLRLNAPIKYDLQNFVMKWPVLMHLNRILPITCLLRSDRMATLQQKRRKQYDTNELSVISTVIEKKFVSSWYTAYVSQDISFPFACKELLDQMINKMFEHCGNLDSMKLVADVLAIILKHIKEYKKAQKRQEKAGKGDVDEYFKTIHVVSPENSRGKIKLSTEHLTNIIKIFLKELLPWELWDTPQSALLVSILTKKLDDFIVNDLSQPEWVQEQLARVFIDEQKLGNEIHTDTKEESPNKISENNEDPADEFVQPIESTDMMTNIETATPELTDSLVENQSTLEFLTNLQTTTIESALSQMISQSTAPILQRASEASSLSCTNPELNIETGSPQKTSEPVDILRSGSILRNRKKPRPISEVRVHDRIVEGSVKTWDSDTDLECISLGQDLLASLDGEMGLESRLGRLWEADNLDGNDAWSPNPLPSSGDSKSPQSLWFGEEDALDMELSEDSPPKSSSQNVRSHESHTTNFSLSNIHNIKDLQNISKSTVNQAKHKIGDLQDEAAGVMEGILDLGMAGLRKGLRLTRLQDSHPDGKESKSRDNSKSLSVDSAKSSSASLELQKSPVSIGTGKSPTHKSFNKDTTDPVPRQVPPAVGALVKQQHVNSQDNITLPNADVKEITSSKNPAAQSYEPPAVQVPGDSPSLEYEDPEDLATTIAKLRQLLQQKSSSDAISNPSEDNSSFELLPKHCNSPLPGPGTPNTTNNTNGGPTNTKRSSNNINSGTQNTNSGPNNTDSNNVSNMSIHSNDSSPPSISESKGRLYTGSNMKPIDVATFADEYDDLPVHRAHIPTVGSTNNMQRLDRLFTRTVTGVFNTIKTAVGADSPPEGREGPHGGGPDHFSPLRTPSHRSNAKVHQGWLFVEGEVDSCAAMGALVAEKRNRCCVEAAQDSLEALAPTPALPTPDIAQDTTSEEDYEECASSQVRACLALLGIVVTSLGGMTSRHAVTHCVTVLCADKVESLIEQYVSELTSWLHSEVFVLFKRIAQDEIQFSKRAERKRQSDICEQIVDRIPGWVSRVVGVCRVRQVLAEVLASVEGPRARLDLAAQLLDVLAKHYMHASFLQ